MRRSATLQARAGDIVLWSYSRTTDGLRIAVGPVVRISQGATDDQIAAAVRTVLDGSIEGIPRPNPLQRLNHVLAVAGVTSERAFNRGARSVGLQEEADGTVILSPRKPEGGGWMGINDKVIVLHAPAPGELASAIREAIDASLPRT
jgi:hypothetical protein